MAENIVWHRPGFGRSRLLTALERRWLAVEDLVNRIVGVAGNPFYHTDTIAVLLLLVVTVTGIYLTIFYRLGSDTAYASVAGMSNTFVGSLMRSIHRYASDLAMVVIIVHALRTLVTDRFRRARWLPWVTGMVLLALIWVDGVSGYWMVWDQRAQVISGLAGVLDSMPILGLSMRLTFLTNTTIHMAYFFFAVLLFLHIVLPFMVGLFFWLHIIRLQRAKFLPPRLYTHGLLGVLVLLSLLLPASNVPQADLSRLPGHITVDPFYLLFFPHLFGIPTQGYWIVALTVFGLLTLLPWLYPSLRTPKATVELARCEGCTLCALDCPFSAIITHPRRDDLPYTVEAEINPNLCVSCGICVGSCNPLAIRFSNTQIADMRPLISENTPETNPRTVIFACQRHRLLGRALSPDRLAKYPYVQVHSFPCSGMIHPDIITQALKEGAEQVIIVTCLEEDCAFREGSRWLQQRLSRKRAPLLSKLTDSSRVHFLQSVPNANHIAGLEDLLAGTNQEKQENRERRALWGIGAPLPGRIAFLPGLVLLAVIALIVVFASDVPYTPPVPQEAVLKVAMEHYGQFRQTARSLPPEVQKKLRVQAGQALGTERFPVHLRLQVDGKVALDRNYSPSGLHHEGPSSAIEQIWLPPGQHQVEIEMDDAGSGALKPVFDSSIQLQAGDIHVLEYDSTTGAFATP